jgi:hypothetical protein
MSLDNALNSLSHGTEKGIWFTLGADGTTYTFGEKLRGLRAIDFAPDQTNTTFYADDSVWQVVGGKINRTLTITTYQITDTILGTLLGREIVGATATGQALVDNDNNFSNFGLAFAEKIDVTGKNNVYKVYVFYNLKATSPALSIATDEESITATEFSFEATASPSNGAVDANNAPKTMLEFTVDLDDTAATSSIAAFEKMFPTATGTTPEIALPSDFK